MQLQEFINSLNVDNEQKEQLKLLILEDKRMTQNKIIEAIQNLENFSTHKNKTNAQNNLLSSELSFEMDILKDVIEYAKNLNQNIEQVYKKVDLNLKKNEIWFDQTAEKISKTNLQNKEKIVQIIHEANNNLLSIDHKCDANWAKYTQSTKESKRVLNIQMYEMKDEIEQGIKDNGELPETIERYIEKITSQYKDKIANISKEFTNQMSLMSKNIDNLSNDTHDRIKDLVQDNKISDLRNQIMGI